LVIFVCLAGIFFCPGARIGADFATNTAPCIFYFKGALMMKVTYICDICGKPQETVEIENVEIEKLGLDTLTRTEREDIIKYNDEQGLLLYSLCPFCFEEKLITEKLDVEQEFFL
jgi:hypothetical protein